jgi:ketosteroid isomerase-like protein
MNKWRGYMEKQPSYKKILNFLIIFIFSCSNAYSSESAIDAKSRQEIVRLLQKWPQDYNAKNIEATCGLFAPDLIASYPGTSDRNYQEMCSSLKAVLTDSNKTSSYEAPHIEQIIIQGDISVVRLIWNLKISYKNQMNTELIKEKGLDVFKRQKDGSWKIAISYAYTATD